MNKNNDRAAAAKVQKTTNSDKSKARVVSKVNQEADSSRVENSVNSLPNVSRAATYSAGDSTASISLLPPSRNLSVTPDSSSATRMLAREEVSVLYCSRSLQLWVGLNSCCSFKV